MNLTSTLILNPREQDQQGALDILLFNAERYLETLDEAIADSSLVIGTTARQKEGSVFPMIQFMKVQRAYLNEFTSKKYQLFLALKPQAFQMMILIVVTALFTFQLVKCTPL